MSLRGIVLACATDAPDLPGFEVVRVGRRPGKSDVDPVLARIQPSDAAGADLIVQGDDGDLAAVVLRMLRRDRIADVRLAYVPSARDSDVARLWQLPSDAATLARQGTARPTTLVRDDAGGVLVGKGTLTRVDGIGYGDNDLIVRGRVRRIDVTPDAELGLLIRVQKGLFAASAVSHRRRAFQIGCDPVQPVLDGVRRERPVERWTWYRHTEDLLAVRP